VEWHNGDLPGLAVAIEEHADEFVKMGSLNMGKPRPVRDNAAPARSGAGRIPTDVLNMVR
jgi:hypothetical protein